MASSAIMVAGSMLINAVLPPPGLPNTAAPSQGSPTYSLQAQGNAARLGSPIPVNYGRMRIYPDFAAIPYTEYDENEQYLYQLFCIGQGENKVTDIRLDNTPIENFADVTTEIVPPLGKVTLFHTAVISAPEAGGQDMSEPITLGPYVLNDVATEVTRIAVDLVFPGGLMGVHENNGDEYSVSVHLQAVAQTIDDAGDPTGEEVTLFNQSISDRTRTAVRKTLSADVPAGRYQVTVQRHTAKAPNHEVKNCSLGAIKGFLVDDNEYGDITLLAMRTMASADLSDAASRLVNVLNERLIPVWDPDTGWSENQITRSPAWAFADAVRSRYGGDFADKEIDLQGLHYLAGLFDSRGDMFDGRFDTEQSLWDGLGKIGQVCRSGPVRQGNLIRLIRDQHVETPSQMFSMANMADFSIDYVMHNDRTADSVKVTYWDETRDYAQTTVLCQLPDDTADNPQEITLFGCSQYEQAWREGMYLAASNRERRQMVSWTTGLEGHIPTFGDLVLVNHDLLGAGQLFSGTVQAVDGSVLVLSADVNLEGEHWYLILRDRYGQPSDPLPIERAPGDMRNRVKVTETLPYIEADPNKERTHYMIGQGSQVSWPVKVTAISPEADDRVSISGCIESEFVHSADEGEIPPPPPDLVPPPPGLDIEDLRANQGGTVNQPVIFLSWARATGADRYLIDYSTDGRSTWQPAGTGQSLINQHEFTSEPGLITVRVAAVAAVRGDWTTIDVNAGGDFDVPEQVIPRLAEPFTGDALKVVWHAEPAAARYLVEVHYDGQRVRALYLERQITAYQYHYTDAQQDAAGRTLTIKVLAQNAEGVNGEFGTLTATNPSPAIPTGVVIDSLIDSFIVRADYSDEPDIKEFRVYGSQSTGFVPDIDNLLATSDVAWVSLALSGTWYFKTAWVDQWGSDGLNFSSEGHGDSGEVDIGEIEDDLADLNDKITIIEGDVNELDERVTTVTDTANDNTTTVQEHAEAIAGLEGSWGVTIDVDGYCGGFVLNNDGDRVEALFRADTFAVGAPGVESLTFVVQDGKVVMPGVSIEDGAIRARHLTANSVTANAIAANTITGNEISAASIIRAGSGSQSAALNGSDSTWRLYAGHSTPGSAPFRVDKYGKLYASNADIRGRITATSGTFTGTVSGSTVTGSTINGGTINGSNGRFTGTVYAENLEGDIALLAAKEFDTTFNYGEGITSNTWHTVFKINLTNTLHKSFFIYMDSCRIFNDNCDYSIRLNTNTGVTVWQERFDKEHPEAEAGNNPHSKTIPWRVTGIVPQGVSYLRFQIIRYTTTGHNVLIFNSYVTSVQLVSHGNISIT